MDFLTAVSTTTVKRSKEPEIQLQTTSGNRKTTEHIDLNSPEHFSKILKDQPDLETVTKILKSLASNAQKKDGFSLVTPGPVSAQIVDTLVVNTIPDYWRTFKETRRLEKELIKCLQSANGLGAIMSRLRPLIADCRQKKPVERTRDPSGHIEDLIDVLEQILLGDRVACQIWDDIRAHAQNPTQKKLMWKEYVAQIASGRILSLVAEGEDVLKERGSSRKSSWLSNGNEYASWLGRNMAVLMKESVAKEESISAVTDLFSKALGLGYLGRIVSSIIDFVINEESTSILELLRYLKAYEQRKYLDAIITSIASSNLGATVEIKEDAPISASLAVSAVATIVHGIIKDNELLRDHLVTVLERCSIPAIDDSLAARRSVIAAIAQDEEKLHNLLEKSLKVFGDKFYITHTPVMQQEALAQTLAITFGYVQRSQPMFLMMMAKSSYHMSGMSNRMASSSPRARFLGIAVGTAISKMVDKPELQLKFDLEGDEDIEAKWYQRLTKVDDKLGHIKDLKTKNIVSVQKKAINLPSRTRITKKATEKPSITEVVGPRIVEILDESSDEDDDLVAYGKPDSDPEDDEDDPTEVNRNKPTAPVYIRDLIAGLRDEENYDRHVLSLATAAPLIRRKANFGSEVTDHIEELASILIGLNDNFDIPEFNEQRQQALIAVLLAKPAPMAQWFARTFFSGDYSIAQRIAMLTTMGLGARELAGLKDSQSEDLIPHTPEFPSKKLPPHLHKAYTSNRDSDPIAKITGNLAKQITAPIAAHAADQLSGPNILKVRTFSSRMEVEKKRSKPIPNALAQIVADSFFFPLTGRWWITTRSSSSSDNVYTSSHLLPPFLHTLALLMHASGQNTLALPQMTREFWELLLSVRTYAASDKGVLRALLFAFLILLEANEDKERLATEQAKELLETQEWVRAVFEQLGAGSEEDEKVRVLAASVVVRCQEVVEKYQRRMAGSMMDY